MNISSRPAFGSKKWKLLPALLGLSLVRAALATQPLYLNTDITDYLIPGNPPPMIDAAAFANYNVFSVGYEFYTFNPELYETWNTLNYTNTGDMVANSPVGFLGSFANGYYFDYQTTNLQPHQMAGTFYNPGNIRCNSAQDGNFSSLGQFKVWATNVVNPGSVTVGVGGLLQMSGRNADLTGANLVLEPPFNTSGGQNPIAVSATGGKGINTNVFTLWNPYQSLWTNYTVSSFPDYLTLTNSQYYLEYPPHVTPEGIIVWRGIFVLNDSPNAPYNVYFSNDPTTVDNLGFVGAAHVEWVGNTVDSATGNPLNSYLYLTCDYARGATTNAYLGGVPDNFSIEAFSTQVPLGAPQAPFTIGTPYPDRYMTNNYSYFNGQLSTSYVATNASGLNPSGNITNLPGVIRIAASKEMNLAFTTISGPNYMSLTCTNQFDGSPGASIVVPFADIALGVTNGLMNFSNVLASGMPIWSGTLNAWSSDWMEPSLANPGYTNEFKVLIVYSSLRPTSEPWIQNLYLHGTNTLMVSDHMNVYGSLYSDARTMVLQTNQIGYGATSPDGELNWVNALPLNANSGSGVQQFPNLLFVTNNGAIRAFHNANFGNAAAPAAYTIPGAPAVAATGTLSEAGTNAVKLDMVTIGTNKYVFVGTLTNKVANQVKIAATFDGTMNNLIAAINHGTGSGTTYSTNTRANPAVTAGALTSHAFTVTATSLVPAIGNAVSTTFTPKTASVNLAWSGPTLANGANPAPLSSTWTSFINHGLVSAVGTVIWTSFFDNDGTISNGTGSLTVQSGIATLTNGNLVAGGDITLAANNSPAMGSNYLIIAHTMIQAGHKLTLLATNISDTGVTNGNIWVVGTNGLGVTGGGALDSGFNIPLLASAGGGDLLGTTVTNIVPYGKTVYNVWAGKDYGRSSRGFANNVAVGRMVLDSFGPDTKVSYVFNGAGVSNALYVDCLVLEDYATHGSNYNNPNLPYAPYNFPWLQINTNMVIYYAQAIANGNSVAEQIDKAGQAGANGGRLRWVNSYAGYFSSTNLLYTNQDGSVITYPVNAALANSGTIDSDSDGTPNNADPTPFFMPSEVRFTLTVTNLPPRSARIQWTTLPNATNYIYYSTNLVATNNWLAFTNFKNWYYGNNVVTNAAHGNSFRSPQVYAGNASLPDNSQQTNVWVFDAITNVPHYYKVLVWPWLTNPNP